MGDQSRRGGAAFGPLRFGGALVGWPPLAPVGARSALGYAPDPVIQLPWPTPRKRTFLCADLLAEMEDAGPSASAQLLREQRTVEMRSDLAEATLQCKPDKDGHGEYPAGREPTQGQAKTCRFIPAAKSDKPPQCRRGFYASRAVITHLPTILRAASASNAATHCAKAKRR